MSLILEALKKLEREKDAPARGVVVVGTTPWPGAPRERRLALFLLGLLIGGGLLALAGWRRQAAAAPDPPVAAAPVAARRADSAAPASTPTAEPAGASRTSPPVPVAARSAAPPSAPAAPPFRLQAISEREGRPVAIVNDRLLREGDSIDGARIVRIAKDEVELELQGRRLLLRF